MAIPPTTYNPLVTPDTIASLLPSPEYQGGPARVTMPSAPTSVPVAPTIDYDTLIDLILKNINIPEVDLSGLEARLGAIESKPAPVPTSVDYDLIADKVAQNVVAPEFDPSGILSAIEQNRAAISSLPTVDLSGLESRLGAIESRPTPTFDPSGILSAIEQNRAAISGLPTFDPSGILSAIEQNRKAIEGLSLTPAPASAPTAPPIMDMQAPQVMPAQQVPAPAPVPAPVYDPVADMFVRDANKYVLDEKGNVVQVPQDTGFIPDTPGGMVSTLDPNQRQKAVSAGLSPENIAALAGDMRVSPSYTPPTAPTPLSAFRNPSENAALDWMSLDDQLGYFFSTNAANPADVKGNRSAFVPLDENAGYRLYDARTGEYVAEGVGAQGLQDVYSTAQNLSATGGTNADWRVEMRKPGSESWSTMARDKPKSDVLGTVADIGLPIAASFIPGVGPVLGAALGSAASSVAQGRSLENTLLRAGLSAGTAGLMSATGADQAIASALSPAVAPTAGEAASQVAGEALAPTLNQIIVSGSRSALPAVVASGTGPLVSSVLPDLTGTQIDVPEVAPTENQIIVPGTRPAPPLTFEEAFAPIAAAGTGVAAAGAGAGAPSTTAPEVPPTENQIVVEAPRLQPMPGAEELIGAATVGSVAAGALPTGGILQSGQTPTDGTTTMETGNSLLDEIIKYYSLGSIGLDALGGALGLGGGGGQAAAPYVSQLGPMPTFTRGGFQPYTGDYETYGFGPEFNFFGGPAPITPTAPAMGVLGPNTPVDTTLI